MDPMDWIVKFEKPTGELARIHREYLSRRNVLNRYTSQQLKSWGGVDLYLLLDLDAYRGKPIPSRILDHVVKVKMCEYHPDVSKGCREAFLLVRVARDVFRSQKLRLFYDSGLLDESIPEDRIYYPDEFFDVFGRCFEWNGRFSAVQPVPELGTGGTAKDAENFYEFWSNFKSWRVYESAEEFYKMNDYEKSQYSTKNKERLVQLKNQDIMRIKRLVQIAKKRDPRTGKSIEEQVSELMGMTWSPAEVSMLKRLLVLLGKSKKNKWETITEKLVEMTKVKRSVSEVTKKGMELERK